MVPNPVYGLEFRWFCLNENVEKIYFVFNKYFFLNFKHWGFQFYLWNLLRNFFDLQKRTFSEKQNQRKKHL